MIEARDVVAGDVLQTKTQADTERAGKNRERGHVDADQRQTGENGDHRQQRLGKPHTFANIADMVSDSTDLGAYREWLDTQFDTSVTWKDIEWLRTIWPGYLIIKGIQEVQDARCAADVGANGLVVSNHGGRQLDSVASSISKLRPIVEAVGDRMEILVDGGVRSGLDVFKALALGANGVLIGRPWVWAAAGGGEAGLCALLNTFKRELEVAMILTGTNRISDISPELIDKIGWN